MCFSILVDKNIDKLSSYFGAMISSKDSIALSHLLTLQKEMDSLEFDSLLGLKHSSKKRSMPFKIPGEDGKVFSNYFTNVIVDIGEQRLIKPMRYRVRPQGSKEEIPSKYNVFNARIDSLESRNTWSNLFMKNHGLVALSGFYEWVAGDNGKAKLIYFHPKGRDFMWAPCLWDEWISKDGRIQFKSFAIITDDPRPEVQAMGHDRSPIFLKHDQINSWLNPKDKNEIYKILKDVEDTRYEYSWVN